jgi:Caenorhabditis protein of unknown function, DUF268
MSIRNVLRRALRPFTGPLDGRVADINRRIADTQLSVRQQGTMAHETLAEFRAALSAYTASVAESDVYVGVELRRLEELFVGLKSDLDVHGLRLEERVSAQLDALSDRAYVQRLAQVIDTPLERLDGAAANFINFANGHRGFAAQAGLWFNPPVTVQLTEGHATLSSVNERIVELPFAFGALLRLEPPAKILDIGAAESTFSLSCASLGYRATAVDLHPLPYSHPNLESVVGRFEDWDPGEDRFDAVFLISTIEHFGLGAYGEVVGTSDADRALIARLRDLLSDKGFLVLTTPYGKAQVDELERTYDDASLSALLDNWRVLERRVVRRRDERSWTTVGDDTSGAQGVAMVLATPDRSA